MPWKQIERCVFKLQKRIYRASVRGDVMAVHRLQRLLMKSWSAKALAVRRVTQDNRGKNTAGVDGVKSLNPKQRLELTKTLSIHTTQATHERAQPTRRVWIPKPVSTEREKRPLGIPTMRDRAAQALTKLVLEAQWEARFEPNSYGFRPGRSAHDAIEAIFLGIRLKPKYVLDADIAKCFDRINHEALLNKLQTYPQMRRTIKAWLKAGVMEGEELFPTDEGTPQGGVISPLLANIALHGLETVIGKAFPSSSQRPIVIRYADDFLVMHERLDEIERCQQIVTEWLVGMGLELKPSKTRITHTLHTYQGNTGFDFLGFSVRQFPVGKTHTGRNGQGRKLGFKTIIKPSEEAQKRHAKTVGDTTRKMRGSRQIDLIRQLNPKIRGWCNYHSTVISGKVFSKMSEVMYQQLRRWAQRRHPKKSRTWVANCYWHPNEGKWDFACKEGRLVLHREIPIRRHVKVQGARSPYDGDWAYWGRRLQRYPGLHPMVATLLKRQRGRCAWCGLYIQSDEIMERDHDVPVVLGGGHGITNRKLLHGHCHDAKTAQDGSLDRHPELSEVLMTGTVGLRSRMRRIVSCPVL
ncbi:MAG: group II intron reverse transcriptase/maturase [Chloroflexota bacterium]|nr:group II intron reverse transcriptase/maturase [Chloroflexota bacterium]